MGTSQRDRRRLTGAALFLFCLFSLLIVQFYRIQILEAEKWGNIAKRQHFFTVDEPFHRGTFFSNTAIKKGHPEVPQRFVSDIQKFHLFVDPVSIDEEHRDVIAKQLSAIIDLPEGDYTAFRGQFDKKSRSRKLEMWLDTAKRDAIVQWWRPFAFERKIPRNALFFEADYQRSYPFGKLLGQVLHTIQNRKEETTKQALPTGGLELYFNDALKGKQGKRLLMRSPRNAFETGEVISFPEHGADIHLTINHYLQAIAEEELAKGVQRRDAKGGWAIMMEPHSGEVLAMAHYPEFSPSEYPKYFNDSEMIERTRVKAITDANEPGSVMKPFTVAMALTANELLEEQGEEPLFDPEEKVATTDGRFPGRSKPIKDLRLHHYLNLDMAIQKSANIYMARLAEEMINRFGKEWYRTCLQEVFGFGEKTGIELPSESAGVVPTPGKRHPNGRLEWSTPTPFSLAFGHNIQLTGMQLVRAFALFANGGHLVTPTLVRKIVKDGEEISSEKPEQFPQTLSKSVVDRVVQALKYVTKPGGSGSRADVWGYTEVGKTGTAEKIVGGTYSKTKNVATFIGFTPIKEPAFVLLVTLDEPACRFIPGVGKNQGASVAAAPIFREIAQRSLEYLGVTPDDPHGYPPGDPRYDRDLAYWAPEARAQQRLYDEWNSE